MSYVNIFRQTDSVMDLRIDVRKSNACDVNNTSFFIRRKCNIFAIPRQGGSWHLEYPQFFKRRAKPRAVFALFATIDE